jgi:hypothetical protein
LPVPAVIPVIFTSSSSLLLSSSREDIRLTQPVGFIQESSVPFDAGDGVFGFTFFLVAGEDTFFLLVAGEDSPFIFDIGMGTVSSLLASSFSKSIISFVVRFAAPKSSSTHRLFLECCCLVNCRLPFDGDENIE